MKQVTLSKLQKSTKQPSVSKHSIQRVTPNLSIYSSCNKNRNSFIKEMSLLSFPKKEKKSIKGSMTVEAAIVVPLFVFFLLNLLGVMEIYGLHGMLAASLREVGRELTVYAYAYERIADEEEDEGLEAFIENVAFSYLYVKERVEAFAGGQYLDESPLTYGREGLCYLESSILQQEDMIDLVVTYQVSPAIPVAGFAPASFYNRYYGRAWTGYDVAKGEDSEEVYVAENAEVYHLERDCTHLLLSVRQCTADEVNSLRNDSGSKYRACEFCSAAGFAILYITDKGDCYHGEIDCSGLKRTVFVMTKEEAEKYLGVCSRCGR